MSRIRTVKPEFWKHEMLSSLPEATHMLAAALINYADDEGYFNANPGLIKAECCPLREPSVSIHDSLKSLSDIGYLRLGVGPDGRRYGHIVSFDSHQRINRPTPSKLKKLPIVWESSLPTHTQLSESSLPEGKGKEQGTGNREQGSDPPVLSTDVAARVLSEKVGNLNIRFQEQLERTIRVSLRSGEPLETCVDRMAGQWQKYNLARDQLNYPVQSAQKFFESGIWHDEKLWPWKEAQSELESYRRSTLGVGA